MISIAKETLFFRRAGISPALRLLVPTFSLPPAPAWVTPLPSSQSRTFSYHTSPEASRGEATPHSAKCVPRSRVRRDGVGYFFSSNYCLLTCFVCVCFLPILWLCIAYNQLFSYQCSSKKVHMNFFGTSLPRRSAGPYVEVRVNAQTAIRSDGRAIIGICACTSSEKESRRRIRAGGSNS